MTSFPLNMQKLTRWVSILYGSFNQGNGPFGHGRGVQCVANSYIFLCRTELKSVECLTRSDLDSILVIGNTLYEQLFEIFGNDYLNTDELPRKLWIENIRYTVKSLGSLNGYVNDMQSLKAQLSMAFVKSSVFLFICNNKSIALRYDRGSYFLFDPHSCDKKGKSCGDGVACILKFISFPQVVNHIQQMFISGRPYVFECHSFQITRRIAIISQEKYMIAFDSDSIEAKQGKKKCTNAAIAMSVSPPSSVSTKGRVCDLIFSPQVSTDSTNSYFCDTALNTLGMIRKSTSTVEGEKNKKQSSETTKINPVCATSVRGCNLPDSNTTFSEISNYSDQHKITLLLKRDKSTGRWKPWERPKKVARPKPIDTNKIVLPPGEEGTFIIHKGSPIQVYPITKCSEENLVRRKKDSLSSSNQLSGPAPTLDTTRGVFIRSLTPSTLGSSGSLRSPRVTKRTLDSCLDAPLPVKRRSLRLRSRKERDMYLSSESSSCVSDSGGKVPINLTATLPSEIPISSPIEAQVSMDINPSSTDILFSSSPEKVDVSNSADLLGGNSFTCKGTRCHRVGIQRVKSGKDINHKNKLSLKIKEKNIRRQQQKMNRQLAKRLSECMKEKKFQTHLLACEIDLCQKEKKKLLKDLVSKKDLSSDVKDKKQDCVRSSRYDPIKFNPFFGQRKKSKNKQCKFKVGKKGKNSNLVSNLVKPTSNLVNPEDIFDLEVVNKIHKTMNEGPHYICCVCDILCFIKSVTTISEKLRSRYEEFIRPDYKSRTLLYICRTCSLAIRQNQTPKFSFNNKMMFPDIPDELLITPAEEKLIALRIPFMQIRALPRGNQLQLYGSIINVPTQLERTIILLPRYINSEGTVSVRIKRRLQYKGVYCQINVRPQKVMNALLWLIENCESYQGDDVNINNEWLQETINYLEGNTDANWVSDSDSRCSDQAAVEIDCSNLDYSSVHNFDSNTDRVQIENCNNSDLDSNQKDDCPNDKHRAGDDKYSDDNNDDDDDGGDKDDEDDNFSEIDQTEIVPSLNTLLDDEQQPERFLDVAPGENNIPLNIVYDESGQELAFPTVYGNKKISAFFPKNVTFLERTKWELKTVDRRAAQNTELLFYMYKRYQLNFIYKSAQFAMRFVKGDKKYTADEVLQDKTREIIKGLDEGYYVYKHWRNSPEYLKTRKRQVFAAVRQLGIPTFFSSLSSADSRWKDLIRSIGIVVDKQNYSDEEIDAMPYMEKNRILNSDPVTCCRFFDNRFNILLNEVIYSPLHPLGEVVDHFFRIEFQHRGSPHVHMIVWCKDAPKYEAGKEDQQDVYDYIDRYISCSLDVPECQKEYVQYQIHKHSHTCRSAGKPVCRFKYPIPPMPATKILEPLDLSEKKLEDVLNFRRIQYYLDHHLEENMTFEELLEALFLDYETYERAVRSSLKTGKMFVKRKPAECRVNVYMKNLLHVWQANIDCQFCIDPYSVVVYIINYINKQQRGLSLALREIVKQCHTDNKTIQDTVKAIGQVFVKSSEVCVQEACYMLLGLSLTSLSREVVYIDTRVEEERVKIVKNKPTLENCESDETEIYMGNKYDYYAQRPGEFEELCFADYCCLVDRQKVKKVDKRNKSKDKTKKKPVTNVFNGYKYTLRKVPRILQYHMPSINKNRDDHFRAHLLLFYPWREENECLQKKATYEKKYLSLTAEETEQMIESTRRYIYQDIDHLQELMEKGGDEDNIMQPGDALDEQDRSAGFMPVSEEDFFRPVTTQECYVHGNEVGGTGIQTVPISDIINGIWPLGHVVELFNELNMEQRQIIDHTMKEIITKETRCKIFITGGAGTGKTKILKTLFQGLSRYFNFRPNINPDVKSVMKLAFTGKAAFLIEGETIHSGLHINKDDSLKTYRPLGFDLLSRVKFKLKNVCAILIDEISMVGSDLFSFADQRLRQIFGTTEPFGNKHMIVFGDLHQLPPVGDSWIFLNNAKGINALRPNVWRNYFLMFELNEIMRQKEDKPFAELLNRLRDSTFTASDIKTLLQRNYSNITEILQSPKPPSQYLFCMNDKVNDLNARIYEDTIGTKVLVESMDTIQGSYNDKQTTEILLAAAKTTSGDCHLVRNLYLCEGLTYDLVKNMNVSDGLANGSSCVLELIQYDEQFKKPSILWVSFSDPKIGAIQRRQLAIYYTPNINRNWVPLGCEKTPFTVKNRSVSMVRKQFPIRPSTGKTIHKSQGSTVESVAVDLTMKSKGRGLLRHAAYVACSRVTTLEGLFLVNFDSKDIVLDERVSTEMDRLRENRCLQLNFNLLQNHQNLCVYYQNIEYLNPHLQSFIKDPQRKHSDIILLNETHATIDENKYPFDHYKVIQNHNSSDTGLAILLKSTCRLQKCVNILSRKGGCILIQIQSSVFNLEGWVGVFYIKNIAKKENVIHIFRQIKKTIRNDTLIALAGDMNVDSLDYKNETLIQCVEEILQRTDTIESQTTRAKTKIDYFWTDIPGQTTTHYIPWSHHFSVSMVPIETDD